MPLEALPYLLLWPDDLLVAGGLCAILCVLRVAVEHRFLTPLTTRCFGADGEYNARFAEQWFKMAYHGIMGVWGFTIVATAPWWSEGWYGSTWGIWQGFPHHELTPVHRLYYLTHIAFTIQSTIWMFIEEKRSDFKVMILHHAITLSLLGWSFVRGFNRVGTVYLVLHDLTDTVGSLTKMSVYLGKGKVFPTLFKRTSELLYVSLVVSWFYGRLWLVPKTAMWSALVEAPRLVETEYPFQYPMPADGSDVGAVLRAVYGNFLFFMDASFPSVVKGPWIGCNVFLWLMQALQIFWFWLFLKIGYILVTKREQDDIREVKKKPNDNNSDYGKKTQ